MGQKQRIIGQADQCVKCGMCASHCPTYRIFRVEGHSPRGRIALIQGLAARSLDADEQVRTFLDACLGCRFCETVCPSRVEYGALLAQGRSLLAPQKQSFPSRLLGNRLEMRWFFRFVWFVQKIGLLAVYRVLFPRDNRVSMLPKLYFPRRLGSKLSRHGQAKGSVSIFIGCTGETLGQSTLQMAMNCLSRFGYDVHVPPAQGCCGLHERHEGRLVEAELNIKQTISAFSNTEWPDKILTVATGCQSALRGFPELADRIEDLGAFLARHVADEILDQANRQSHPECRVFLHRPCTQQYLKESGMEGLLSSLPGVTLICSVGGRCCGASGSQFLRQSAVSNRLAEEIVGEFKESGATVLLSSNMGCELHLRASLRAAGVKTEVQHPLEFLAGRL